MSIAVLGPTFQTLAANVHRNVSDIYYVFVGRSLGYLGGSVLGGVLFDCTNAHLLLGECRPGARGPFSLALRSLRGRRGNARGPCGRPRQTAALRLAAALRCPGRPGRCC